MLNSLFSIRLLTRAAAACALLAGATFTAQAGGLAVGVDVPAPFANNVADYRVGNAVGPVGVVNVGYRVGGGYRGGYRGGYGGGYHGGYRGGYYGGGGWGWGVGLGLGAGLLLTAPWTYPQATTVIIEQPPQTVLVEPPLAQPMQPMPPMASMRPEPVIYPRNGQTAQQLESDRQDCNRWATTQAAALNDSSVFMRAVDACMDGRGYTTR